MLTAEQDLGEEEEEEAGQGDSGFLLLYSFLDLHWWEWSSAEA